MHTHSFTLHIHSHEGETWHWPRSKKHTRLGSGPFTVIFITLFLFLLHLILLTFSLSVFKVFLGAVFLVFYEHLRWDWLLCSRWTFHPTAVFLFTARHRCSCIQSVQRNTALLVLSDASDLHICTCSYMWKKIFTYIHTHVNTPPQKLILY